MEVDSNKSMFRASSLSNPAHPSRLRCNNSNSKFSSHKLLQEMLMELLLLKPLIKPMREVQTQVLKLTLLGPKAAKSRRE
jgi:hypothetical protein